MPKNTACLGLPISQSNRFPGFVVSGYFIGATIFAWVLKPECAGIASFMPTLNLRENKRQSTAAMVASKGQGLNPSKGVRFCLVAAGVSAPLQLMAETANKQ